MPTIPCPISIYAGKPGCDGVDEPVSNFSSEAPDRLYFTGIGFSIYNPYVPPPLGGGMYLVANCAGVEFSASSQQEANLLAQSSGVICQVTTGGGGIGVGGPGTGSPPIIPVPNPPPTPVPVFNQAQTASNSCSSLATFTYTLPAGRFVKMAATSSAQDVGAAQTAVDAQALAYAQQRVINKSFCILPPPTFLNNFPACVNVMMGYTLTLGGTAPSAYWTVSSGSLPPGVSLSPTQPQTSVLDTNGDTWVYLPGATWVNLTTGETVTYTPAGQTTTTYATCDIVGTPTQAGNFTFTVRASALNGAIYSEFPTTVTVLGFSNTNPLPHGTGCVMYNETLKGVGGTGPYTFTFNPLALPPSSLTILNGILHGLPAPGTYAFDMIVTDRLNLQCKEHFSLTINATAALAITTDSSLPLGHKNSAYNVPIVVTGGCAPYVISLYSGSLPSSFSIRLGNPWYVLLGTVPNTIGTFSFTLKATDSLLQSVTKAFTVTIDDDLVVTGSCADNPTNDPNGPITTTGMSPQITYWPHPPYRLNANSEATLAAAINDLVGNLMALGCDCPPLMVNVDPSGANTSFSNASNSCTITARITYPSVSPYNFSVGPGQSFNYGDWWHNSNGGYPNQDTTFNIGGGVSFTIHYSTG